MYSTPTILDALQWKEDKSTVEWALENVFLTSDASPYPGPISFERTPWIAQILEHWDRPWVEAYNIMASTQVGKTTLEFIVVAKEADTSPAMIQITIPTDDGVSDFVATKFDPFFKGVKSLQDKMEFYKNEEKIRTKGAMKRFPGGAIFILGNTEGNRRSKTVKFMVNDEVALYGKGHVEELEGRTKSFEKSGRKVMNVSSRKFKGDEIEEQYGASLCKWDLGPECPECGEWFYPGSKDFKMLQPEEYLKENGLEIVDDEYIRQAEASAHVSCPKCGHKIDSLEIEELVYAKKVYLKAISGRESDTRYGYRKNALATGLTNYSTIARLIANAKGDPLKLDTIYKDYFNEVYEAHELKSDSDSVFVLRNEYQELIIPEDTVALFMSIDTQKDHFWVTIRSFGYGALRSDLVYASRVETFDDLDLLLDRGYFHSDGKKYVKGIRRVIIDMQGYVEKEAYHNEVTGEVIAEDELTDRMREVRQWVYTRNKKDGQSKDGFERVYAAIGRKTIKNGDLYGFGSTNLQIEGRKDHRKLKIVLVNTTATKVAFLSSMGNTIRYLQGELDAIPQTGLHYVSKDIIDRAKKDGEGKSYHRQVTAEVWTQIKSGGMGFVRFRKDNHFLDTEANTMVLSEMDKIFMTIKPESVAKGNIEIKDFVV